MNGLHVVVTLLPWPTDAITLVHVGKYYLVDSGYPNLPGYLAPYKMANYNLHEFGQDPMDGDMKETFNLAHSSLRNAVERSFGVLKEKWRVMHGVPQVF